MMLAMAVSLALAAGSACHVSSPAQTQVLVELYTSQGCSSCPPADRWLSRFDPADSGGVVPLAFHVGYWDYIGWKDPYARREFNERQRWLAGLNRNATVYTPGVFVQAQETPRWSSVAGFNAALKSIAAQPARARIDLAVERSGDALQVRVDSVLAPAARAGDPRLFLALTESGLSTKVKAGENRGETLRNDHVAREWTGALPLGARSVSLATPASAATSRAVVAFVQDVASGEVLQAVRLPLASCAR